ncbi:MDR-type ABC transporter [Treponema primitia ZAS-2]|uniref:MDR-type ABC transporter n=1 Tax=Treponema primitia (strain ATCC BAA-887 / DSM 12427 / ZAS-2) TaxID=545694 RepID=F5YR69_TREPZ|nr:ABC transporter ATP-binding protein [Treponema primitia]AEF86885.1 MDR-type ABC transporter [Treponema primitia ZAS-2]
MLKDLLTGFIKRHALSYTAGILILFGCASIAMRIPGMLGGITDALVSQFLSRQEILRRVLLVMSLALIVFSLKFVWRWFLIGNSRAVEVYLRGALFRHLQTLPLGFYSEHKTGDLVAHAINDVQAIRMAFGPGFIQSLDGITTGILSVFFMSRLINPRLAILAVLPVPFAILLMFILAPMIRQRFRNVQEAYAAIADRIQESISGIRIIKSFAQEKDEVKRFIGLSGERVSAQIRLTKISALLTPGIQICFGFSFLLFIIYGSRLIQAGQISVGDFIAFNLYLLALMAPVTTVGRIIDLIQKGNASYSRLEDLFNISDNRLHRIKQDAFQLLGAIEFRHVSFRYPGAVGPTLEDISFKIKSGETFGIAGATGSGKTTIANLILRLYDPDSGEILIDGENIQDIPVDVLRESIGYVPQDNFLFSTTIKNNIEFFSQSYKMEEIEEAARLSEIYDNIISFPDGFDTLVGERGVTLSGGQKQRVSIARALIKDPAILILDDSLSAVDSKTEQDILKNIRRLLEKRSGILISHRLSTIEKADHIILLDRGRIIEQGSHRDLIRNKGTYTFLWEVQSGNGGNKHE